VTIHLGISCDGTFEDSVVRIIGEHLHSSPRSDALSNLVDEDGYASQLLSVPAELPCKHAEKLVEDLFRKDELISTVDEPSNGLLRGSAREDKGRDEDVRIENYLHDVR
jgi:hypothetical protein